MIEVQPFSPPSLPLIPNYKQAIMKTEPIQGPSYSEWTISFAGVSIYPLCSDIFGSSIQIRLIEVIAMNFKSDALAPILVNLARLRDDP